MCNQEPAKGLHRAQFIVYTIVAHRSLSNGGVRKEWPTADAGF